MSPLFALSSRLALAAVLATSICVSPAMADSLTVRSPQFTPNFGGAASSSAGGGGGGHQSIMNDDYYHTPKATDPGAKLNLLTAKDKPLDLQAKAKDAPLDTSSFLAKDPNGNITVLTAKDGLLPDSFVIRDPHKKTDFLVVQDANGHKIAMWIKDLGARHIGQLNDYLEFVKQQEIDKTLPDCKPDTPYNQPCAPRDCWQEDLFGLPCPR